MRNTGTLIRDDAAPATGGEAFTATLRNSGLLHVVDGALDLGAVGEQTAGRTLVDPGATLGGAGGHYTLNGGRLEGTGTVAGALENAGGIVAPGASPGVLAVDGAYTQGPGGTLETEVTGLDAGTGYDRLAVSGAAIARGHARHRHAGGVRSAAALDLHVVTAGDPERDVRPPWSAPTWPTGSTSSTTAPTRRGSGCASPGDETEGHVAVVGRIARLHGRGGRRGQQRHAERPAGGRYSVRDTGAPVAAGARLRAGRRQPGALRRRRHHAERRSTSARARTSGGW